MASGTLGVLNVHVAPGLGNAMGMLHDATKTATPLLVTAGQQDRRYAVTEPLLWGNLVRMVESMTKWAYQVERVEDIPRALRRAIKVATTPPTGPVFLGVALAFPDRPILGLIGDGSAMYSIQGLWTAARYNLRTIFIICNNGQYLILTRRLHAYDGPAAKEQAYIGMDLASPAIQFVDLARALGVHAERAEPPVDLHQALKAAMRRHGPTLIDVPLEADFPVA